MTIFTSKNKENDEIDCVRVQDKLEGLDIINDDKIIIKKLTKQKEIS